MSRLTRRFRRPAPAPVTATVPTTYVTAAERTVAAYAAGSLTAPGGEVWA